MTLETLGKYFQLIIDGMKYEFTIFGFTMSFWGILVMFVVASIILGALGEILNGN